MAELTTLLVDWGGVLTTDMRGSVHRWLAADGIDLDAYGVVMREWMHRDGDEENPFHVLERGEMTVPEFEALLAASLVEQGAVVREPTGLVARMFAQFEHAPDMAGLVLRARRSGLRTGLVSNSWGNSYPRDGWDEMFDLVVISGEVGMRKPERRIYEHTLALLDLDPASIVFVDDIRANIEAATDLGMVGVLHTSYETTRVELETLFGRSLD